VAEVPAPRAARSAALGFQERCFKEIMCCFGEKKKNKWLKAAGCEGSGVAHAMATVSPPVAFPFFVDLRRPELLLNNTVNLYLATEPGVTVGIW